MLILTLENGTSAKIEWKHTMVTWYIPSTVTVTLLAGVNGPESDCWTVHCIIFAVVLTLENFIELLVIPLVVTLLGVVLINVLPFTSKSSQLKDGIGNPE